MYFISSAVFVLFSFCVSAVAQPNQLRAPETLGIFYFESPDSELKSFGEDINRKLQEWKQKEISNKLAIRNAYVEVVLYRNADFGGQMWVRVGCDPDKAKCGANNPIKIPIQRGSSVAYIQKAINQAMGITPSVVKLK